MSLGISLFLATKNSWSFLIWKPFINFTKHISYDLGINIMITYLYSILN
ncbi:hypothetical protein Q361_10871 [Flavobacterium croceum DSM 17960]|uniref:Uncharacterized protein n=1 Tax=Flavobacterium croceum DSM 17960 TaxID=1121886 RepID=A0A2S4N7Q4_9FLAO|nr:hypothetical protein Q361_10871 [Flavobacterium croceum DSM 17960]